MKRGKSRNPALLPIIILFALAHGIYGISSDASKTFAGRGECLMDRANYGATMIKNYQKKEKKGLAMQAQEEDGDLMTIARFNEIRRKRHDDNSFNLQSQPGLEHNTKKSNPLLTSRHQREVFSTSSACLFLLLLCRILSEKDPEAPEDERLNWSVSSAA